MQEKVECPECGKLFGSEETLEEHVNLEHDGKSSLEDKQFEFKVPSLGRYWNRSFGLGLLTGVLLTATAFSGYIYWNSLDHSQEVTVTVLTCDNCSYGKFRNATDRMFKTEYREVDFQSSEGQQLIQKYSLNHVPGFIFNGTQLERADNFTRVRNTLGEFEDAYVIPDDRVETAQRLSDGFELKGQ